MNRTLGCTPVSRRVWKVFNDDPSASLTLICFPHAGGHASQFKRWTVELPAGVEVRGFQMAGRGDRLREPPYTDLRTLVEDTVQDIAKSVHRPFAIFGHSLGAIVGFEVARLLRTRGLTSPVHLFVAGRRAPQLPLTDPPTYNQSDEELICALRELNGTPAEVLADRELLRVLLPSLRADFSLAQTYNYVHDFPLRCPISVFGGSDDEESLENRLDEWRVQTTAQFRRYLIEGDHFFVHTNGRPLLRLIASELRLHLDRTGLPNG